ncbi:hypothetical protein Pint_18567 [Pistacia integerrima]|uniref:Uncharacterized protein n=1 Tax=Pistacia integerrima TaxID=434235 RepID=A0ACC0YY58_9ROSI|nr:hypothetical protein Pint_18567 [Pistacia integerrima]
MELFEFVTEYISQILALTNQMKMYGEEFNDQTNVEKILRIVMTQFDHIMVAIEEVHDLSVMTVDELSGTLQAHKQHMNEKNIEKPIEQAF